VGDDLFVVAVGLACVPQWIAGVLFAGLAVAGAVLWRCR
jgi:hypothetical protein